MLVQMYLKFNRVPLLIPPHFKLVIFSKLMYSVADFLLSRTYIAYLHDQNKSDLFEYFLNCTDWLDKSRPSKKPLLF